MYLVCSLASKKSKAKQNRAYVGSPQSSIAMRALWARVLGSKSDDMF